jgi:hypothetical protein
LANVSPGFALKPWVQKCPGRLFASLKGLRGFAVNETPGSTPSELRLREVGCVFPGLPKPNPGLELANAFSVIHSDKSSQGLVSIPLFVQSAILLLTPESCFI